METWLVNGQIEQAGPLLPCEATLLLQQTNKPSGGPSQSPTKAWFTELSSNWMRKSVHMHTNRDEVKSKPRKNYRAP